MRVGRLVSFTGRSDRKDIKIEYGGRKKETGHKHRNGARGGEERDMSGHETDPARPVLWNGGGIEVERKGKNRVRKNRVLLCLSLSLSPSLSCLPVRGGFIAVGNFCDKISRKRNQSSDSLEI